MRSSVTTFSAFTAFRLAKMQSTLIEAQRKRKRVLHGGIHHASTRACDDFIPAIENMFRLPRANRNITYEWLNGTQSRDDIVFFTR
jgi:hypothetical protein